MEAMSAGLSAKEWGHLAGLLQRFAENDLERAPDEPAVAFRLVEPPTPYRNGRAAHVSNLPEVRSRADVLRVIGEMIADFERSGAAESTPGT